MAAPLMLGSSRIIARSLSSAWSERRCIRSTREWSWQIWKSSLRYIVNLSFRGLTTLEFGEVEREYLQLTRDLDIARKQYENVRSQWMGMRRKGAFSDEELYETYEELRSPSLAYEPAFPKRCIVSECFKPPQLLEVTDPAVSEHFAQQLREPGIG